MRQIVDREGIVGVMADDGAGVGDAPGELRVMVGVGGGKRVGEALERLVPLPSSCSAPVTALLVMIGASLVPVMVTVIGVVTAPPVWPSSTVAV